MFIHLVNNNIKVSLRLLEELQQKGWNGTGTVRQNRVEKAPLIDYKELKKKERGSFHQLTEATTGVSLVRFHDNSIVTVASTQAGVAPLSKVKRFSQAEKKHIQIQQPASIVLYNAYMGGVDRLDENISKVRVNIRGKKWYYQTNAFPLNASVNNALQLHRWSTKGSKTLDLLHFTREICKTYFLKYSSRPGRVGRPSAPTPVVSYRLVPPAARFDRMDHYIQKSEKQGRCKLCKKNARMECSKCKVTLHTNCFGTFHTP